MSNDYGKAFEEQFKQDWLQLPDADITRLYDITNGFKRRKNVCDFICYRFPYQYFIECKSTSLTTLNFKRITQRDDLTKKIGKQGILAGVVIWFIEHHKVCYVSIEEINRLISLGYKSINVKMIGDNSYDITEIPGIPKRVFINSDYSILQDLADKKFNSSSME